MEEINLGKALESLAGAESDDANGRYNYCANRCNHRNKGFGMGGGTVGENWGRDRAIRSR